MRLFTSFTLLAATALSYVSADLPLEYEDELRRSYVSRRAIDGTRGRKYFDPREDGFFDDYGFERGQYHGTNEKTGLSDLRNNVPGEPGVDYPAYVRIPRTTFSCIDRERGYYADEQAGCQVFHVCDEGLVSSFLCPVGSLFSQRLLTCDWWSKVPCSQSHEFYDQQNHAEDRPLLDNEEMLHQALTETTDYRRREPQAPIDDQQRESDKPVPILVNVRRNENQLVRGNELQKRRGTHGRGEHQQNRFHQQVENKDSPVIRIKPAVEEESIGRSRARGHSSFRSSSSSASSQGHRGRPLHESTAATEPSVTTTAAAIAEKSHTSATLPKEDNHHRGTTRLAYETSSQQYQDTTSASVSFDAPTKKGLEEGANETTNPTELGDHNSAFEYDDMEGRESIGLASSHAERHLEKEDEKTTSTVNSEEQSNESTTLESLDNVTPVTEDTLLTTLQDEKIQAKESIGLIHSKVQEKLQLYDNEKVTVTKQRTEESVSSVAEGITLTTQQYQPESSTLLYNNGETSTEVTTSYTFPENEIAETVQTPKSQEVRKMSGFRINVSEKKPKDSTTPSTDEISVSDYQELLNSSDTSFTSTISPITALNLEEEATIIPNNVRRISDAVEESNSPFEITLTLNDSSSFVNSHEQNPIGAEILTRLISQHENQPVDLSDLEIVRSDQPNREMQTNHNQHQVSNSAPGFRTYQNFRNYQAEQSHQQNYRNYKPQPTVATTFKDYHDSQEQYVPTTTPAYYQNYQTHQDESQSSRSHQYLPTTTQAPNLNVRNYQSSQDEPRNFRNPKAHNFVSTTVRNYLNYEEPLSIRNYENSREEPANFRTYHNHQDESRNFGNPKVQNFISSTIRNYLANQDESLNVRNYQNQPEEPSNLKAYPTQPGEPRNLNSFHQESQQDYAQHNVPGDFQNYHVNYQTHRYPEKYSTQSYDHYQNTENPRSYQKEKAVDNSQNHQSQESSNYPDYQNYDSGEDLVETTNFGDFGARISAKNPNANTLKVVKDKPRTTEAPNAHTINSALEGKNANFLYAMSQLVKSDRLPRPFTQEKNDFGRTSNSQDTTSYRNNFVDIYNKARNNVNNFNDFRHVSTHSNNFNNYNNNFNVNKTEAIDYGNVNYNTNYNDNLRQNFTDDVYNINVDEFAAPRLETYEKNVQNQNFNVFSSARDERFNRVQSTFGLSDQQNSTVPRQEKILNYDSPLPVSESPVQILQNSQPDVNAYSIQNTPEANTVPINNNQQFVQIPQADYNDYNIESDASLYNKNIQIPLNPQPQLGNYNFQSTTPQTIDSTRVPIKNLQVLRNTQPQSFSDYDFQSTTPQTIENTRLPVIKNLQVLRNTQSQPIDYDFQSTTPQIIDNTRVPIKNLQVLRSTQPQPTDYDFRPTVQPTVKTFQNDDVGSNNNQRYKNYNITRMLSTTKTTVETEFIPSLSFDFGSDEGRKEYLDALEKGLVASDDNNSRRSNEDVGSLENATVEKSEEVSRSKKSENSEVMDNFKDTRDVMSGTE